MGVKVMAVFCGSKEGNNKLFVEHAQQVADILVEYKIQLIYGGGGYGLMGAIANGMLAKKGSVIGVMPKILTSIEKQHNELTELHVVDDMHIRKRTIYEKCDAALILPGGYGTLDEMFEIITWNQLKIHNKKIILLNSGGFYNHLIDHLTEMQSEGFLYDNFTDKVTIINSPEELRSLL